MKNKGDAEILMIEDNETHRFIYGFQFEKAGYSKFKAVATAEEGLAFINNTPPDIVLLDLVLTGEIKSDGISVLKEIKKNPKSKEIPVVVISNKREKDMGRTVKRLGANGYILKAQYVPRQIVEQVERFLKKITR